MRNVQYITNGFGSPVYLEKPGTFQYAPVSLEQTIAASIPFDAPDSFKNAAIATYRQYGLQGWNKTLQFVDAVENAEQSLIRMFPNLKTSLSGPGAGAVYKRSIKSMLNTAASRIGLTPLSSAILNGVNQWLNSIPDSSTDPRMFPMPRWLSNLRSWVNNLR
jgi:hypothetical protein